MTPSADNLRVKRTRILLREALIGLIEEQGFDSITVGALTERAMVSRAAFYRNYQDKYDLVEQIFEEALNTLFAAIGELGQQHPAEVWIRFFEHIEQYERLYRTLLGSKGSPWFTRKMRARLAELIKERGSGEIGHGSIGSAHAAHLAHSSSDSLVPDLVATMFVEAITWWLEQGKPYTAKEIATKTALLAAALFKEASLWQ